VVVGRRPDRGRARHLLPPAGGPTDADASAAATGSRRADDAHGPVREAAPGLRRWPGCTGWLAALAELERLAAPLRFTRAHEDVHVAANLAKLRRTPLGAGRTAVCGARPMVTGQHYAEFTSAGRPWVGLPRPPTFGVISHRPSSHLCSAPYVFLVNLYTFESRKYTGGTMP
jgi:hypothetical protein